MRIFALLAVCAALSATATAQRPAPFVIAETGEAFGTLDEAVRAIGDRRGTIRIAPGRYGDCAVQVAGVISYVAVEPGTAIFEGGACEDKATLVLRGRGASVEGLIFTGISVPDGNGSGIRIEEGDLDVSHTLFTDSQGGILSANDPSSAIRIDHSTFRRLGKRPDGNGAHSLYINYYGQLTVTNSRFEQGTGGHYLKSRAPVVEIANNSFDDSEGRETNYHIDLSVGATGRIAGNVFVQGVNKENYSTIIAVSPEGRDHSTRSLVIENNRAWVSPGFPWNTVFVGDWSGEGLTVRNNELGDRIAEFDRR
ncbi:MAG: right-handed parallel beta-helix repeat-containing protein [Pseudomonadota bacterium]